MLINNFSMDLQVAALPACEHALVLIKEKGASDAPEYSSEVCKVKGNTWSQRWAPLFIHLKWQ